MTVRPLIEQWFPAPAIGAESLRERGASSALPPLNFLHVWWARRPLTSCRAAVLASLLPAWPTEEEAHHDAEAAKVLAGLQSVFQDGPDDYHRWFLMALGIKGDPVAGRALIQRAKETGERLAGNGYGYPRAFTVSPEKADLARIQKLVDLRRGDAGQLVVVDPFAGGGSIPFEAVRYGAQAVANELNPVAAAILAGTIELPMKYGPGFATTLQTWGERWSGRVEKRLLHFFPKEQDDASVIAYVWAHTVPCPSTGRTTPLAPDFWLARGKAGKDVAIRLEADASSGEVTLSVVEGPHAKEYGSVATYKRGVGTSIWTGETFSGDYIREQAQAGNMGEMLLAVSVTKAGARGRQFRPPSDADLKAVAAAKEEVKRLLPEWEVTDLIPTETIPFGTDTRPQKHGFMMWRDLFAPRQLLTAATALEELRELVAEARGEEGEEVALALNLYLGFALDKAVDYNGMLSSWHSSRMTVRNVFDRHDFSFKWSFAEFDGASALLPWTVNQVVDAYKGIAKLLDSDESMLKVAKPLPRVLLGSATDLPLEDASVDAIVTDPPYYDNVMYAECSDYFYVWLKRSLRDSWPQYCDLELTDKESEAVANPSLFKTVATPGKSATDLADEHYEELLTRSFLESHRILKPEGVMTVMFTHKRVDAWDTLGQALLEAGFSINSSWPVHTESEHSLHQAQKNAASSTIFLTCRKRESSTPAYWADIKTEVAAVARQAAERFSGAGLVGIDLTISTFGPALSVLSRNWPVFTGQLDDDGQPLTLRPDAALDLAREEVARLKKRGLLGGREVEFDRVSDWYLLAWNDFKAAEFPSGEALKLSIATHLELDDLVKHHKVIRASSGTVTLLTPGQRRTASALNAQEGPWPTFLDALQSLMLIYEEDGLGAARSWLEGTGRREDPRFADFFRAALNAIPRLREKGEFVRPEAMTLEGMRATLFDGIEAPPEAAGAPPAEQLVLGE